MDLVRVAEPAQPPLETDEGAESLEFRSVRLYIWWPRVRRVLQRFWIWWRPIRIFLGDRRRLNVHRLCAIILGGGDIHRIPAVVYVTVCRVIWRGVLRNVGVNDGGIWIFPVIM